MDDGIDTGGFDSSNETGEGDSGTFDISEGNVEIEISAEDVEIPITDEKDDFIGNPDVNISVSEHSSINISNISEHEEWSIDELVGAKGLEGTIDNLKGAISSIKDSNDISEAEKTDAIKANVNETMRTIGLSNLQPKEKVDAMKSVYDNLPDEARTDIYVPSDVRFLDADTPFNEDGEPNYQWEGNLGFDGKPEACTLTVGATVDRYGSESGSYVCEVKNGIPQDYDSRALPYEENPDMYHQYEVVKDIDGLKTQIENLTVDEVEQIELQLDLAKPVDERRSPEQLRSDAENKYAAIICDAENTSLKMHATAAKRGWQAEYRESELMPMRGKIKEAFSDVDENGNVTKKGGGEQICLPASVDTLVYLGYMKEK